MPAWRLFLTIFSISLFVYFWLNVPIKQAIPGRTAPDELIFKTLDVGQGDALYLRLPSQADILIDTGPDDRVLSQLGTAMPLGDRKIELLIISHNHLDHIGGLPAILNRYQVDRIWLSGAIGDNEIYQEVTKLLNEKQVPITYVKAGDLTEVGAISTIVLHPPISAVDSQPKDQHDATIALKITYNQVCLIMTGDLAFKHEESIVATAQSLQLSLDCPILKVSHHGSGNSTSVDWLNLTKPKVAVISVGTNNRYHHPAEETLNRLKNFGANIYRTDLNGTITIRTNGLDFWTNSEQ